MEKIVGFSSVRCYADAQAAAGPCCKRYGQTGAPSHFILQRDFTHYVILLELSKRYNIEWERI